MKRNADNIVKARTIKNYKDILIVDCDITKKNCKYKRNTFVSMIECMVGPEYKCITQYKFDNVRFTPDVYIEELKLAFEFDGNPHYDNPFKIVRVERKEEFYKKNNIKVVNWPYYVNPTKDLMKHFFGKVTKELIGIDFYTDEKYDKFLKNAFIVELENESQLLGNGFHKSEFTPGTLHKKGLDKLMKNINSFPKSVRDQIRHSIKLYLKDVEYKNDKREWIVIPSFPHTDFDEFMKEETDSNNLNHIFLRQPEVVK